MSCYTIAYYTKWYTYIYIWQFIQAIIYNVGIHYRKNATKHQHEKPTTIILYPQKHDARYMEMIMMCGILFRCPYQIVMFVVCRDVIPEQKTFSLEIKNHIQILCVMWNDIFSRQFLFWLMMVNFMNVLDPSNDIMRFNSKNARTIGREFYFISSPKINGTEKRINNKRIGII